MWEQAAAQWLLECGDLAREHQQWSRRQEQTLAEKEEQERIFKANRKAVLSKCARWLSILVTQNGLKMAEETDCTQDVPSSYPYNQRQRPLFVQLVLRLRNGEGVVLMNTFAHTGTCYSLCQTRRRRASVGRVQSSLCHSRRTSLRIRCAHVADS
jgi:hypothetical protein